jgi:AraC-like DNA-binding protein
MSRKRHAPQRVKRLDGTVLVRTHPLTVLSGYRSEAHQHAWHQLTYAAEGVITLYTAAGTWIVLPHRALWVPAGTVHSEAMSGTVATRSLYFVPGLVRQMPENCCALNVPPLLRELILAACNLGALDSKTPPQARLIGVIVDQLEAMRVVPLQLPAPRDPRAVRTAELLRDDPSLHDSLPEIARRAGASARTIERLFRRETGMPFGQWRQRQRLVHALQLLARGESVTNAALESGYSSTSAFIAMFRKTLGTTPSRYFSAP